MTIVSNCMFLVSKIQAHDVGFISIFLYNCIPRWRNTFVYITGFEAILYQKRSKRPYDRTFMLIVASVYKKSSLTTIVIMAVVVIVIGCLFHIFDIMHAFLPDLVGNRKFEGKRGGTKKTQRKHNKICYGLNIERYNFFMTAVFSLHNDVTIQLDVITFMSLFGVFIIHLCNFATDTLMRAYRIQYAQ